MLVYHLLLSLWVLLRGVRRDRINLHSWSTGELARDFLSAPARFGGKCMSGKAASQEKPEPLQESSFKSAQRAGENASKVDADCTPRPLALPT